MANTNKTNDGQFIVRAPKKLIDEFTKVASDNATNRAQLMRMWIKDYIKENKKD